MQTTEEILSRLLLMPLDEVHEMLRVDVGSERERCTAIALRGVVSHYEQKLVQMQEETARAMNNMVAMNKVKMDSKDAYIEALESKVEALESNVETLDGKATNPIGNVKYVMMFGPGSQPTVMNN